MTWILIIFTVGVNFTVWASIGLFRAISERVRLRVDERAHVGERVRVGGGADAEWAVHPHDLAALIPAHNEEKGIADAIGSLRRLLPASQIFVVSDGSVDATAAIARSMGVNVLELSPAGGKARALQAGIDAFELTRRFKAVLFLDGDTQLDRLYLAHALPLLSQPGYVAVAGYAKTRWQRMTFRAGTLIAHRERIYVLMQVLLKFGQTARRFNVTYIVPGFASIYRSEAIEQIDITAPGLIIEDFNMTFEVHRKRLGKIGFTPQAFAYTQDPDTLSDYTRQVKRWALGFWQTFRRHGLWLSGFSAALLLFVFELITSSITFLFLPLLILTLVLPAITDGAVFAIPGFTGVYEVLATNLPLRVVLVAVLVPDFLLSVLAAAYDRRPELLKYAIAFPALRVVDAAVALWTLPLAFRGSYSGTWKSPARR